MDIGIYVTGASSGIGLEICKELVRREKDITIIVWNSHKGRNKAAVRELASLGVKNAIGYVVDVGDREQVKKAAQKIRQEIGDVTMIFNNAGISGEVGPGWLMSSESIERVFQVNMLSYCWTVKEFLPGMIRKGKGHLVSTCSTFGFIPMESAAPYAASKHAMDAYMESIKEDVRRLRQKCQIYFTTSYPFATDTKMLEHSKPHSDKYPFLMRYQNAADVANGVVQGVLKNQEYIYFPTYYRLGRIFLAALPREFRSSVIHLIDAQYNMTCEQKDPDDSLAAAS